MIKVTVSDLLRMRMMPKWTQFSLEELSLWFVLLSRAGAWVPQTGLAKCGRQIQLGYLQCVVALDRHEAWLELWLFGCTWRILYGLLVVVTC